jgi:hypothetical protein
MGTSWVAEEMTKLLDWRRRADGKLSRVLVFVHQVRAFTDHACMTRHAIYR